MSEAVRRGHLAQSELNLTEEVFASIRQGMLDKLLSSSLGDQALRERLYMGINGLDLVRKTLKDIVLNGQHQEAIDEMQRAIDAG
jgi:DNA-binding protein Fis